MTFGSTFKRDRLREMRSTSGVAAVARGRRAILYGLAVLAAFFVEACRPKDSAVTVREGTREKTTWVEPGTLHAGPVQKNGLSASEIERIERVKEVLDEVDESPLDNWIDDFSRDQHPSDEIKIYEDIAEAYRNYCKDKNLSLSGKKDVYLLLILRSGAPAEQVLERAQLRTLSRAEAEEVLRHYTASPAPVRVSGSP